MANLIDAFDGQTDRQADRLRLRLRLNFIHSSEKGSNYHRGAKNTRDTEMQHKFPINPNPFRWAGCVFLPYQ